MAGSSQPDTQVLAAGQTATVLAIPTKWGIDLRVEGEVDLANGGPLLGMLTAIVAEHRPRRVTLDLADLTFVDGAGRRALRTFVEHAGLGCLQVKLIAPEARSVRLSLEIGGLRFDDAAERESPASTDPAR